MVDNRSSHTVSLKQGVSGWHRKIYACAFLKEHARLLTVHGPKPGTGLNMAEDDMGDDYNEVFWASTDGMDYDEAVKALGDDPPVEAVMALYQRRKAPTWQRKTADRKAPGPRKDGRSESGIS